MDKSQKVRKVIEDMDSEVFVSFQHELQYAMKWHDQGYARAQTSVYFDEGENADRTGAISGCVEHERKRNEISESLLYGIVREEIPKRFDDSVSEDWCGWVGLESENDIDAVHRAIRVLFQKRYSIAGLEGVRSESITEAQETLEKYKLKGVFNEFGGDLTDRFLECFG